MRNFNFILEPYLYADRQMLRSEQSNVFIFFFFEIILESLNNFFFIKLESL